ncbi:MAG: ParB N-terminal domain-containing protein [candidate division Zixibacteria bacterium]|nr:ParB N-terminal domain-containing protein [candidate division Zixibacteria bacterium]
MNGCGIDAAQDRPVTDSRIYNNDTQEPRVRREMIELELIDEDYQFRQNIDSQEIHVLNESITSQFRMVPLDIVEDGYQLRLSMNLKEIHTLAETIKVNGMMQPVGVRHIKKHSLELPHSKRLSS